MIRSDIIKKLFFGFNRDPHSNDNLVGFFCEQVYGFDEHYLEKAVDSLISQHTHLPKVKDLVNRYYQEVPKQEKLGIDCHECGGVGLIFSVFREEFDTHKNIEMVEYPSDPKDGHYREQTIGRCRCANGNGFSNYPHVDVPLWIKNLADRKGYDCVFTAQEIARSLNIKVRGTSLKTKGNLDNSLSKLTGQI